MISVSMETVKKLNASEVLSQLDRILASSHFRSSHRSSAFLRFVVTQSLHGSSESLKERTIGIEVFHREPSFDTSSDCIVRVAASEVRKRIAQYYQEPGNAQELRIELPLGSYIPSFQPAPPGWQNAPTTPQDDQTSTDTATTPPELHSARRLEHWKTWIPAALLVVAALGFLVPAVLNHLRVAPMQTDWLAAFDSGPQQTLISVGVPELKENQPGASNLLQAALGSPPMNNALVTLADATSISRVQEFLSDHHHPYQLQIAQTTTFDTLRTGPVILIAALDNPWTMRLTANRRFFLRGTDMSVGELIDRETNRHWTVDFNVPYSQRTADYALVSITRDETLGQPLLVVAGVGPNGTMAASEFLLKGDSLNTLMKSAPRTWEGKNMEAVLSTTVIAGVSGPPKVEAVHFW